MDQIGWPAVFNGLAEAVYVLNEDRCILIANSEAQNRFGKTFRGQDFVRVVRHPDCLAAIDQVLSGDERSNTIIVLDSPVRATYNVTVTSLGTGNEDGARAVVSFDDVSHVREAEQMRSDFVANVSHELRSPLTALSGFVETLKGAAKDDPDARERFLDMMEHEAHRMTRLIGDLLSLSLVEVNERVRPTETVDLASIINQVTATLGDQATDEGKTLRFDTQLSFDPVSGDRDELTQIFQNLIENAIRYGARDTEIIIRIEKLDYHAGIAGPALAVSVRDRGEGIAPEHLGRLTERFYRVDASRSRDKGGTGLGLAIVKHILNRHRGRLLIASTTGEGSTFTVLLSADETPA